MLAVGLHLSAPRPTAVGPPPAGAEAIGAPVHGWFVPPAAPGRGAVLLLHGVWENRRRMLARADRLRREGYGVLLIDLPAHGESPGARITFGARESAGAAAALAWLRARLPGERMGAIGISLGGAATLLGPAPLPVEALVLESVYPTIDAALANRLRVAAGAVPAALLAPLFHLLLPPGLGVSAADLRPIDRISGIAAPLLLVTGAEDNRTTPAESRVLFSAAPAPKRFLAIPGAGHVDLATHDPDRYWGAVLPFLAGALRTP